MEIRRQMVARAAKLWDVPEEQVEYGDDGVLRGPQGADGAAREMSFKDLAAQLPRTGGMIAVSSTQRKNTQGPAYGGHIVDLHVDRETGKVTILRYTAVQDVGVAIHPSYVEGQIQGGVAQGIGMALNEEYVYDEDGRMLNSSFLDYRMPVANDIPMIDTVLVEVPNPGHPFGVRGVGEVPIVPPLGAIANAIYDAVGVRMTRLPASPGRILEELDAPSS
jgi:CO/xanthine dehydrogenase Mo-binding subunit